MSDSNKRLDVAASSSRQVKTSSVVLDQGENSSACGYCKSRTQASVAHGLWAYSLTVNDYQDLLDRGWRRSGMYLYQPIMRRTCCPQYTIRLRATSFIPSKEQRRVLNRMQRFLDGSYKDTQATKETFEKINDMERVEENSDASFLESENSLPSAYVGSVCGEKSFSHPNVTSIDEDTRESIALAIKNAIIGLVEKGSLPENVSIPEVTVKRVTTKIKSQPESSNNGAFFTSNAAFCTAAGVRKVYDSLVSRQTRRKTKQSLDCKLEGAHNYSSTTLAEELASIIESSQILQGLTVNACKGHLNFFPKNHRIDGDCSALTSLGQENNEVMPSLGHLKKICVVLPSAKHVLDIEMKRSEYDPEEFSLYKKYQVAVHNDKPEQVRESAYKKFLVDTPLIPVSPAEDGSTPFCGFGSFHQQYRIDGRLIAVGVVDILPRCLSSKYLFWDPDFAFLSLGKYAALNEINWVQMSCKACISLEYYYLGYYIHSCAKMQYKAAYCPSELLCPEKLLWVPYDVAKPLLDKQSYTCLSKVFHRKRSSTFSLQKTQDQASSFAVDMDMKDAPKIELARNQQTYPNSLEELLATKTIESKDTLVSLNNIPLRLNGIRLRFQQMESWGLEDMLKDCLKKYLDRVGSVLAARMEYVLA